MEKVKKISDEIIAKIENLAKLKLSVEEKEKAKQDMEQMVLYIEELNELDTTEIEPMGHVFHVETVFREDMIDSDATCEEMLANAPEKRDSMFCVPKTIS